MTMIAPCMIAPDILDAIVADMKANKTVLVLAARSLSVMSIVKEIQRSLEFSGIGRSHYRQEGRTIALHLGGSVKVSIAVGDGHERYDALYLDRRIQADVDRYLEDYRRHKTNMRLHAQIMTNLHRYEAALAAIRTVGNATASGADPTGSTKHEA